MNLDLTYFQNLMKAGFPLWILCAGGLVCVLLDSLFTKKGTVYIAGVAFLIAALVVSFNQWIAGGSFKQDVLVSDGITLFSIFIVIFAGIISLFNSYAYLKAHQSVSGEMVGLTLFSIVGMIFLFASDHLLVNFVGLETLSLAIYVMVGSNKKDGKSNEAAMKYFIMGSVASAILLYGIGFLFYSTHGVLRLSELTQTSVQPALLLWSRLSVVLILIGFFFKLAIVPFHFWVPDVYEGAPTPVTGFMSTAVKVSMFALLIRVLTQFNYLPAPQIAKLLSIGVVLTLVVGNLAAIVQDNIKRMLAYSSISHAGFVLLGLAVGYHEGQFDPAVTSSVLFYLLIYTFMTLGAFAVLSVLVGPDKEVTQFHELKGLGYSQPVLAGAFSLFMLSLLGIPPLAGFAAKFGIINHAVSSGHITLAVVSVLTSLIAAYYYLKPIVFMYFMGKDEKSAPIPLHFTLIFSIVFCLVAIVYLGIRPHDYIRMAEMAVQAL